MTINNNTIANNTTNNTINNTIANNTIANKTKWMATLVAGAKILERKLFTASSLKDAKEAAAYATDSFVEEWFSSFENEEEVIGICPVAEGVVWKLKLAPHRPSIYLGNAFSLQMVEDNAIICKRAVEEDEVPLMAKSIIGHADTAAVVSNILEREVEMNRESVHLTKGDLLYVAQVVGGRLPEGATTLPEGVKIKFYEVEVK